MSRNQGVVKGIVPLTISPNDPPGKLFLSVSATLNSAGLELLVLEGEVFLPTWSCKKHFIELEAQTASWSLWVFYVLKPAI